MEQLGARRAHYPEAGGSSPPPATKSNSAMADKIKLIWTDEELNSYGFWVLSSGIDMSRFKKNPIMLFNHHRTFMGSTDEILPIGRWENFGLDKDGRMTGEPVFDKNDPFAAKVAGKVEGGFLTACSIGIKIIEVSEDARYLKPGQTRPTVIKSELREVSVVDIPSNPNAAGVVLYDSDDKIISLSDGEDSGLLSLIKNKDKDMKQIALKLGLPEAATEAEVLAGLAAREKEMAALKAERDSAVSELKELKEKAEAERKSEAASLLESALKDGRIDASMKESFAKLFEADFASAKTALLGLPERRPLSDRKPAGGGTASFESLSWDEIDRQGKLKELKDNHPDLYQKKFEEMSKKLNIK